MKRKIISMITLGAVILLNFNCYTSKELSRSKTLKKLHWRGKSLKIVEIETKTGKIFKFPMDNPALFGRDTVITKHTIIPVDTAITTKDTIIGTTIDSIRVSIPASDVDQVKIRKLHPATIVGIVALVGAGGFLAFMGIAIIVINNSM